MNFPRWGHHVVFILKLLLALCFVLYGVAKIAKHQFYWRDFTYDSKVDSLFTLSWYFYGRSWIYTSFIGMTEIIAALLLATPRTTALGSIITFGISLHITFLDFCYEWPEIRFISLGFTILAALFCVYDWPKIRRIF